MIGEGIQTLSTKFVCLHLYENRKRELNKRNSIFPFDVYMNGCCTFYFAQRDGKAKLLHLAVQSKK